MDIKSFRKDITECISLCKDEIMNRKDGIAGESSIDQIEKTILPELNCILDKVDVGQLPPCSERYLISFANAFKVWGWDMQQPTDLFIKLANLNNEYKQI